MTSEIVIPSPVRVKKEAPKVSIEISQQELSNYISLQIRNYKYEQLNCRLDQYWKEGTCRPCEEICGIEITQLCQRECPGYPLLVYKRNEYIINTEQNNEIFINKMMIYGAIVLLVAIIVLQAWCLRRTDDKPDRKSENGVNGSTTTVSTTRSQRRENPLNNDQRRSFINGSMTTVSTTRSQRRENPINSTERGPFITPNQGNNIGPRLAGVSNQQRQFNNFPITHDVAGSQLSLNS